MNPLKLLGMLAAVAISVPVIVYTVAQTTEPSTTMTPAPTTPAPLSSPQSSPPTPPPAPPPTMPTTTTPPSSCAPPLTCGPGYVSMMVQPPSGANTCATWECRISENTSPGPVPSFPSAGMGMCPPMTMPSCAADEYMYSFTPPGSSCPSTPECRKRETAPMGMGQPYSTTTGTGNWAATPPWTSPCPSGPATSCPVGMRMYTPTPTPGQMCPPISTCIPDSTTTGTGNWAATGGSGWETPGSWSSADRCAAAADCPAKSGHSAPTCSAGYCRYSPISNLENACPPEGPAPTCAPDEGHYRPGDVPGTRCRPALACRKMAIRCPEVRSVLCGAGETPFTPPPGPDGCPTQTSCRKNEEARECPTVSPLPSPCPSGTAPYTPPPTPFGPTRKMCPGQPYCKQIEQEKPGPCPAMPTVTSCGPNEEMVTTEYKGCGNYSYCKPKKQTIVPEPEPCPAVASPTSCEPGKVLKTSEGRCPFSYCVDAEGGPPVTKQELRNVLQQVEDQQRQLKQVASAGKKFPAIQAQIAALQNTLDGYTKIFSEKTVSRQQLDAYRQSSQKDFGDDLNKLRQKVEPLKMLSREIPPELRRRRAALTPLEKLVKNQNTLKDLSLLGIAPETLTQTVAGYRSSVDQMAQLYDAAIKTATDEAVEAAEEVRAGMHEPGATGRDGELRELTNRLRELSARFAKPLKAVKDEEVRAALLGLLSDVVAAVNENDLDGLREAFAGLNPTVRQLFVRARSVTPARKIQFLEQIENAL